MPKVIAIKDNYKFIRPGTIGFFIIYKKIRIYTKVFVNIDGSRRTYTSLNLFNKIHNATSFSMVRKHIDCQYKKEFNPLTGLVKETLKNQKLI